ncbi:PAS domain S-box protein [Halorutilales archaeon Cl-col2-1]
MTGDDQTFESIVENIRDGVVVVQDGEVVYVNERTLELTGYTEDEIIGESPAEFVAPDYREELMERYRERLEGEEPLEKYEVEVLSKEGESICAEMNVSTIKYEGEPATLTVLRDISERIQYEDELEGERNRAQKYFDTAGVMMVVIDEDHTVSRINKKGSEVLGYDDKEEVIGKNWFENFIPERERDRLEEVFSQAMAGEIEYEEEFESPILTKDGEERVISWRNTVITDEEGEIVSVLSSGEDITERKERQKELQRYEAYIEESTDLVIVQDDSGVIQYQGPSVTRILGYEPGELVGKNGFDLLHPEDEERAKRKFRRLISEPDERVTLEARFKTADGEWRWLEVRGNNQLENPAINGIISNSRDITQRKKREQELEDEKEYTDLILDAIEDTLYILDSDGYMKRWNQSFSEVTGYSDEEIGSMHATGFFPEEETENVLDVFKEVMETGSVRTEETFLTKDGEEIPYEFIANRLKDKEGNTVVVGIGRDISKRVEYESELEKTRDRLQEAQRIANIGHWVSDFENIEWSDEVYRIFGVEVGGIDPTHEKWLEFVHPDDRERVQEAVDEALEKDNYDIDHRIIRPDGEIRIVHEKGDVYYEDGEPVRMVGTVQDVTKESRLESMLNSIRDIAQGILQAETKEEILESSKEALASRSEVGYTYGCTAIGVLDQDGDLSEVYDAGKIAEAEDCESKWRSIYSEDYIEEVLGEGVLYMDDVTQSPYQQHPEDTESHPGIALALKYRDTEYGVMTLHLPVEGISDEERTILEEIAHDLSIGLYTLETEERIESERDELTLLNRIVRHDIRNDMNLVLGWGDMLRDHVDDEGEEYLETVLSTSQHVVDLTKTARDFVDAIEQEEEMDLRPTVLSKVLKDSVEKRKQAYDEAEFSIEGLPKTSVKANDLLSTAFRNILNNAVQHNDKETPKVEISAEETDGDVVVSIADNGPGVPDSQKEEIFGRGEKGLESGGTGIGLYLVQTLVDSYNGEVWVEDNVPEGSVFKVKLKTA